MEKAVIVDEPYMYAGCTLIVYMCISMCVKYINYYVYSAVKIRINTISNK